MTANATAKDALKAEIDEVKDRSLGSITVGEQTFEIVEKPDALLLSELARTGTGDPEAFGVVAEFFDYTLGADGYRAFKKAARAARLSDEQIMSHLQSILEQAMGRPTE